MERLFFVYILTNREDRVLYTGVTNDMKRRLYEHQNKLADGFSKKYNLGKLLYFESVCDVESAILREKQIKGWTRKKKIDLINTQNPNWIDRSEEIFL